MSGYDIVEWIQLGVVCRRLAQTVEYVAKALRHLRHKRNNNVRPSVKCKCTQRPAVTPTVDRRQQPLCERRTPRHPTPRRAAQRHATTSCAMHRLTSSTSSLSAERTSSSTSSSTSASSRSLALPVIRTLNHAARTQHASAGHLCTVTSHGKTAHLQRHAATCDARHSLLRRLCRSRDGQSTVSSVEDYRLLHHSLLRVATKRARDLGGAEDAGVRHASATMDDRLA
jgi:hypothetical protein